MSHYEERLEHDLSRIRRQAIQLGEQVLGALERSTRALLKLDREEAARTVLGDLAVNQSSRVLDHLCHVFVARHLPSAGHLRLVSSVMRMSIALERIGDYAETISRTTLQLSKSPPETVVHDIELMADHAWRLLSRAMKAFQDKDPGLARETMSHASQSTATFDKVFADLVAIGEAEARPVPDLFGFLATMNRLERVVHQAKNICEETIFIETGQTKPYKRFDVLFVDERNDGASLLAEAYARKGWPDLGSFESAGWSAAPAIDARFVDFARDHGMDLSSARPRPLTHAIDKISDFEVIVDLGEQASQHLPKLPFHTIPIVWRLPMNGDPETAFKEIAPAVRGLMETLGADREGVS